MLCEAIETGVSYSYAMDRGRGTILCSSATAAFRGSKNGPSFPIAKFGLRALTQSVAKEYSSKVRCRSPLLSTFLFSQFSHGCVNEIDNHSFRAFTVYTFDWIAFSTPQKPSPLWEITTTRSCVEMLMRLLRHTGTCTHKTAERGPTK